MDDELRRLRREVRSLRRLLTISYPYVPWDAHGPRFRDAPERAVMGDAWVERVRAAVSSERQGSA